jgi:hypothetical protein
MRPFGGSFPERGRAFKACSPELDTSFTTDRFPFEIQ